MMNQLSKVIAGFVRGSIAGLAKLQRTKTPRRLGCRPVPYAPNIETPSGEPGGSRRRSGVETSCAAVEPSVPDWEAARRLWDTHAAHGPECRAQLAAGAFLSYEE